MTMSRLPCALVLVLGSPWAALADGPASVTCEVTENGGSASGALVLARDGVEVARGACGDKALSVPAGTYAATLALDGALDAPQHTETVTVAAGASERVKADFATGTIEVRIQSEGRRAAGMAIIRRDGAQIGTLGNGVSAHLSAGRYEVVARYRTQERTFAAVVVDKGAHVVLDASF